MSFACTIKHWPPLPAAEQKECFMLHVNDFLFKLVFPARKGFHGQTQETDVSGMDSSCKRVPCATSL